MAGMDADMAKSRAALVTAYEHKYTLEIVNQLDKAKNPSEAIRKW